MAFVPNIQWTRGSATKITLQSGAKLLVLTTTHWGNALHKFHGKGVLGEAYAMCLVIAALYRRTVFPFFDASAFGSA